MNRFSQIVLLFLLSAGSALSQTATEALRYSTQEVYGTARYMALGGAMGALGADFGTINSNPAGTGAYRSSEFLITGTVLSQKTEAELLDGGIPASVNNDSKFSISNIGIVFATQPKNRTWKASNFAIGYNKTADYDLNFNYSGRTLGSITDRFAENAQGLFPDELNAFEDGIAYDAEAIYDLDEDLVYETDYQLASDVPILRRQQVARDGSNGEVLLAYGANYNEKLLFGISLSIPILSFDESKEYEEEDAPDDPVPFFNALRYEETLRTSGNGFNVKLGLNYKITNYFTIGGAFHSRTRYSLTDNFGTQITYDFTIENDRFVNTEPIGGPIEGNFNYHLSAPWSVMGNVGYIITTAEKSKSRSRGRRSRGKKSDREDSGSRNYLGFIVAQIHYTDYSKAKFDYSGRGNGDQFDVFERQVNEDIVNSFQSSLEMRFGAEFILKGFRLRGGLIMTQSPYAGETGFNNTYSAGLGYRFERLFLDFGYQFKKDELFYSPYSADFAPVQFVTNNTTFNRFAFTVGYKWL